MFNALYKKIYTKISKDFFVWEKIIFGFDPIAKKLARRLNFWRKSINFIFKKIMCLMFMQE